MIWALDSPAHLVLAAALLFGAGLGFGGVTGKGWLLLNGLKIRTTILGTRPGGRLSVRTAWPISRPSSPARSTLAWWPT
jgi:hypothetical protein